MQLTKFDRWLKEKLIYRTHIYTMRLPEGGLPSSVLVEELEDSPTRQYKYRLVANASHDVDAVINILKQGNQMFATRIEEIDAWYKKIIAPEGKSFFFRMLWISVGVFASFGVITLGAVALANEKLRGQLLEAWDLIING